MEIILQIAIILILAKLIGELFEKNKLPAILGEILVGIILGPYFLNLIELNELLKILSDIGIIFLLFIIGFEKVNIQKFSSGIWKAIPVSFFGAFIPLLAGFSVTYLFGFGFLPSLFVGVAISATSIAVSARTLLDLNYLSTVVGITILSVSVLDSIMSIILLTILSVFTIGFSFISIFITFSKVAAFVFIVLIARKYVLVRIAKFLDQLLVDEGILGIIIGLVLIFAVLADKLGFSAIVGAFLLGVLLSGNPILRTENIVHKIRGISYGLFIPFFFVSLGLMFNLSIFFEKLNFLLFALIITAVIILVQIASGRIGGMVAGFNKEESTIIGTGLIPRNELLLVIISTGMNMGVFGDEILSSMIFLVMITTVITPVLLRRLLLSPKFKYNNSIK